MSRDVRNFESLSFQNLDLGRKDIAKPPALTVQSHRFSAFDAGYITTGDVFANINWFFKAPAYTHDVAIRSEWIKQPLAVAELVSLTPSLLRLDATAFKGPALVITGEYDWILCGGYCEGQLVRLHITKYPHCLSSCADEECRSQVSLRSSRMRRISRRTCNRTRATI